MRHYATGLLAALALVCAACGDNQEQQDPDNHMAYPAAASLPAPAPPPAAPPKAEPPKPAQQTLRLDGLRDGDQGMMPGTFSAGEGVGVVFAPAPDMYPFRVVAVQVVLAGELPSLEVAVHRVGTGDVAPGERYASATAGRTAGVARVDFEPGAVVRSGPVMVTATLPRGAGQVPAFVVDPAVSAPMHTMAYVSAAQGAAPSWHRTVTLGVRGAWAVRLIVERAQ